MGGALASEKVAPCAGNARLSLAGRVGIITQTSGAVAAGAPRTFEVDVAPMDLKALRKGDKRRHRHGSHRTRGRSTSPGTR